jgi:hypothetical protein
MVGEETGEIVLANIAAHRCGFGMRRQELAHLGDDAIADPDIGIENENVWSRRR